MSKEDRLNTARSLSAALAAIKISFIHLADYPDLERLAKEMPPKTGPWDPNATIGINDARAYVHAVERELDGRKSRPYGQGAYSSGPYGGLPPEGTDSAGPTITDDDEPEWVPENELLAEKAMRARTFMHAMDMKVIDNFAVALPELWELLVVDLNHGGQGADPELAHSLGVNVSFLNKFIKQKKPIPIRDAVQLADRIVTYLRSQQYHIVDGNHRMAAVSDLAKDEAEPLIVVKAIQWKVLVRTDELAQQIAELIRLIGEVIEHASTTNLPADQRALTDIERAQLIAVLKTALKMLEAPMVEKGLLKKAGAMAKRAANTAAEKQVELAFSGVASMLGVALLELLKHL